MAQVVGAARAYVRSPASLAGRPAARRPRTFPVTRSWARRPGLASRAAPRAPVESWPGGHCAIRPAGLRPRARRGDCRVANLVERPARRSGVEHLAYLT